MNAKLNFASPSSTVTVATAAAVSRGASAPLPPTQEPAMHKANTVVQWNAIALSTVTAAEQSPAARLRVMTLVHVAMFEALNFNQSRYRSEPGRRIEVSG